MKTHRDNTIKDTLDELVIRMTNGLMDTSNDEELNDLQIEYTGQLLTLIKAESRRYADERVREFVWWKAEKLGIVDDGAINDMLKEAYEFIDKSSKEN